MKFCRILFIFSATVLASSCNPVDGSTEDAILGHWVSPTWTYAGVPVYADFSSDGEMKYLFGADVQHAKWSILPETGELKVTFPSNSTRSCNFRLENNVLAILNPSCLFWNDLGETVALEKQ